VIRLAKRFVKLIIAKKGYRIERIEESPILRPWEHSQIIREIGNRSLLDPVRLYMLQQCVIYTKDVEGDVAEFGVYKGGSAKLIAHTLAHLHTDKKLWLFDTFEGLPEPDFEKDPYFRGGK
jgi:hypothetical protein